MEIIRVGVDLAKNVFQVHGVDSREVAVWQQGEMVWRLVRQSIFTMARRPDNLAIEYQNHGQKVAPTLLTMARRPPVGTSKLEPKALAGCEHLL